MARASGRSGITVPMAPSLGDAPQKAAKIRALRSSSVSVRLGIFRAAMIPRLATGSRQFVTFPYIVRWTLRLAAPEEKKHVSFFASSGDFLPIPLRVSVTALVRRLRRG